MKHSFKVNIVRHKLIAILKILASLFQLSVRHINTSMTLKVRVTILFSTQGDSGSPVVSDFSEQRYLSTEVLQGIVSYGDGVCNDNNPSALMRVTSFCPWISATTGGAVQCPP